MLWVSSVKVTNILPELARYWVGNSGLWSNASNWSNISGGSGGSSVPTSLDNAIFDYNSFTLPSQTLTIDVSDIPVLNFSNSIPISLIFQLNISEVYIYGNNHFISLEFLDPPYDIIFESGSVQTIDNITCDGLDLLHKNKIKSSLDGVQHILSSSSTKTTHFCDVKDSSAIGTVWTALD